MALNLFYSSCRLASLISLAVLFFSGQVTAQDQEDLNRIKQSTKVEVLRELGLRLSEQAKSSKSLAEQKAKEQGWFDKKVFEDGRIIELKGLGRSGKPIYFSTANINAAKTVGANKTWTGGSLGLNLSGNGIILREWDAGQVRPNHQELINRTIMGDGATNLADHSTHIAGTMLATGIVANAHGMSNQATLRAFDWFNDYAEMTTEAANGALLSNHSYIFQTGWLYYSSSWYWYGDPVISQTTDYFYGFYMDDAAIVDQIAYNAPYYLVCKAVGNDRLGGPATQPVPNYAWINNAWVLTNTVRDLNGGPDGWDCISSGFGVSKNIMSVGAVYSIPNGYTNPSDVVFASFSGTGPTDDGRIKPDIVADGIGLYSTLSGGNTSYGYMGGTSMATPNVTGSLGLLQEHYHTLHGNFMLSSTLRGLAIHTANEAGPNPGPDYKFGWGVLNISGAATALSQQCNTLVLEDTLMNGSSLSFSLNAKGTEPLVATVCWTDPPGTPPPPSLNPPTLMLVNDLDMRIDGSTYKPYVLDPANVTAAATAGDNFRDNVEKIYIQNPSAGNHVLSITHKTSLSSGMQAFSLIVTGLNSSLIAGTAGSGQIICANSAPLQLQCTPPIGAIRPYTYQWQYSTDNLTFTNIQGATALNYQPGVLASTTYYRVVQTSSGNCGSVFTNTVNVTVNPLPVPTVSGAASVCIGATGVTYTTEASMTGYTWVVSAGGTITSGAGTNSVTVNWNTAGAKTISVNYTNVNGCTASAPTVYNMTVNPLPQPTITGPTSVCVTSAGNVYTTETGMSGYVWTVSAGGTITGGGTTTSSFVAITWNTSGPKTITVNYANAFGCLAAAATGYNVTVNPLPAPTISGAASVCVGTTGVTYNTEASMTGYTWVVSAGGTITSGAGTNSVTVTWNTAGTRTISVNYTNANGCTASAAALYNVTVNALPSPTITGPTDVCATSTGNMYTTQTGMTGYVWTVSAGGTITGGGTTTSSFVAITWNTSGPKTITVNYANAFGCLAATAPVYNVTVNPLPVPTITGPTSLCANSGYATYVTEAGNSGYSWSVSPGGQITAGQGSNSLIVSWITSGAQWVKVNYFNISGCTAATPAQLNVTVTGPPPAAGVVTGTAMVCAEATGVSYSVEAVAGALAYSWNLPAGVTIVSGQYTNSITVDFAGNAISGDITAAGNNLCGDGPFSPPFPVTVNPIPSTPSAIANSNTLTSSSTVGNQWYWNGTAVAGATSQVYVVPAVNPGYYWTIVTLNGCISDSSNHVYVSGVGIEENESMTIKVYPVPNNGVFMAEVSSSNAQNIRIQIYNTLGATVYQTDEFRVSGTHKEIIDVHQLPAGIYSVVFTNEQRKVVRKVMINKFSTHGQ